MICEPICCKLFPAFAVSQGETDMSESTASLSLQEVSRRLGGAGCLWAVFAGAAAAAYGATRPVTDLDILVPAAEGGRVAALFPEAQVDTYGEGLLAIRLPGVDILAGVTLMDLDAQMAARLTCHPIGGVHVPVIPAEDNILLKAIWGRGPDLGKHDWEDVEAMMACVSELDWDYLHWRARTSLPMERARPILQRLRDVWHRRRGTEAT